MKNLAPHIFLFLFLFIGCTPSNQKTDNSFTKSKLKIPKLLDRPTALHYGKEWDDIQNRYATAVFNLHKKDHPKAYLQLCEVFINEARVTGEHGHYYPAALKILSVLEEKEALSDDFRFQLLSYKASVLLSQHEFQKALEAAEKAVVLNNYNAQIYGVLVDAHVELGNYTEAVKMADKMVSIRPDLRSYSRISYLREIHGDMQGAIEAMQLAVAAGYPGQEQSEWARLTLGNLFESIGDLDQAANHYQTSLKNRENYPFAIAALANVETQKGQIEKAEMLLKDACSIIPEVGFYEQLAKLYHEKGDLEKAIELENRVLEMLKDDVESGHNMNLEYANFYLNIKNDPQKALEYALKEYQKRPKNIEVNKMVSTIYLQTKELDKAEKHLKIAKSHVS